MNAKNHRLTNRILFLPLNARQWLEFVILWPIANRAWIATNADVLRYTWRRAIKHVKLEPSRRTDVRVWRCQDRALIACTSYFGEDSTLSHPSSR